MQTRTAFNRPLARVGFWAAGLYSELRIESHLPPQALLVGSTLAHPRPYGRRLTRPANIALFVLFAGLVLSALRCFYYWVPTSIDVLLPLANGAALGCWALLDARERGISIPLLTRYLFVVSVAPAMGYLVWTRGWRGVALLLAATLAYAVAASLMAIAGTIFANAP